MGTGAKFGELGLQHIFPTNSPRYCSPPDMVRLPLMPLGKSSTHPWCAARNCHLSALLVHYRCPPLRRGWDLRGHECAIECPVHLGQRFVTVPPPLRHCWWVRSANKCHPEALANAAAPDRCREQRRRAAALPIHIRWGAVFLW
ncbi:hypothetical protein B0H14DRAFT_3431936 [Mycena olivaceomarginata]|nr:hypothetical protein B0H14DRAFT_3431936 [Mycena olivaceomarginata]